MMVLRTERPYENRRQALVEARRLYVDTGIEKNITEAFRRYMKETGEDFPIVITKESRFNYFPYSLRPKCPECGDRLYLELLNTTRRNQVGANEAGIPFRSFWTCTTCDYIGDWSVLTPQNWRDLLEKENE